MLENPGRPPRGTMTTNFNHVVSLASGYPTDPNICTLTVGMHSRAWKYGRPTPMWELGARFKACVLRRKLLDMRARLIRLNPSALASNKNDRTLQDDGSRASIECGTAPGHAAQTHAIQNLTS